MNPNLWLVLGTAVFFGLATGVYEYVFPLFLSNRGIEVGKVLAWTGLGGIAGPLAAGFLAGWNPIFPFLFSGLFMIVAVIPLLWLNPKLPVAGAAETAAAVSR